MIYQFKIKSESENPYAWHKQIWGVSPKNIGLKCPFVFVENNGFLYCRSVVKPDIEYKEISMADFPLTCNFQVTANVVKTINKKRYPVTDKEQQKQWIHRQIGHVDNLKMESPKPLYFFKNGRQGVLHRVTYTGTAEITCDLFINGIGHAKRFGLGMILCKI